MSAIPQFNPDLLIDKDDLQEALKTFVSELRYRFSPDVADLVNIIYVDRTTITSGYEGDKIKKIPVGYVAVVAKLACEKITLANPSQREYYQKEHLIQVNKAIKSCYPKTKAAQFTNWEELATLVEKYIDENQHKKHKKSDTQSQVVLARTEEKVSYREDIGRAPDISSFRGREKDLSVLKKMVSDAASDAKAVCQVLLLLGRGGSGKTYLSLKLVEEIKHSFSCYIWRSLEDAREVDAIMADWIKILSNYQETDLPNSFEAKLEKLLYYLRQQRCLLVLDNLEAVWKSQELVGVYRAGCENYGRLISAIGTTPHQSCLILTSREKPEEVKIAETQTERTCTWSIRGLELKDVQRILKDKNINSSEEEIGLLVKSCGGNPRTLQRIFYDIVEYYGSDVNQYLAYHLAPGNVLDDRVAFDEQFIRLSVVEQNILYWLAVEREPVDRRTLLQDLQNPNLKYFGTALDSLVRRLMIEKFVSATREIYYGLQPLDKQYITDLFIERLVSEVVGEKSGTLYSVALLKAQAANHILRMQLSLIAEPVIDGLLKHVRNNKEIDDEKLVWEQVEELIVDLIRQFQARPKIRQGYAGGNLLNLLCSVRKLQNNPTITGYDFSNLNLWQAYLSSCNIQDTNFSNSDLTRAIFTDLIDEVYCVIYSPDGKYMAAGDLKGGISVWETTNFMQYARLSGHSNFVRCLIFTADGKYLISGSMDATIRVWDMQSGKCIKILTEHQNHIWALALSIDGKLLLSSSSNDGEVKVWDTAKWEFLRDLKIYPSQRYRGEIRSLAFSSDGKWLAVGGANHTLEVWDAQTFQEVVSLNVLSLGAINSVDFSNDNKKLVTGSDDRIVKVWQVGEDWPCLLTLEGHTDRPNCVVFSPDDTKLASGARDGTVRIWDAVTGQCLNICKGHKDWIHLVTFSPDGKNLVSCGKDHTIRFWDVDSGECTKLVEGYSECVFSHNFSPDGTLLATGGDDLCVRLWSVSNGKCTKAFRGHKDRP